MSHPEQLQSPDTREGYVEVPGGRVWYETVGASKSGIPLLTLHGGPGFTHDDLITLRQQAADRPVIFYDQLGVGKSDRPDDNSLWTLERAVAELEAVREALRLDRIHLFGFSWGGTVVAEYLITKNPSGVESAILSGPYLSASLTGAAVDRFFGQISPDALEIMKHYEAAGDTENPEYKKIHEKFDEDYVFGMPRQNFPDYIKEALDRSDAGFNPQVLETVVGKSVANRTGNLREHERVEDLAHIQVPTLYISGRYDQEGIENMELYHDRTPGSEFVVIEDSAHMPFLTHPELFNNTIADFMQRVEGK